MEKHDVIIIGGGPSGATLAHFLKEKGIYSVVIEKGNHFRDKVCAGGLPLGIFDILPQSVSRDFEYVPYKTFRVSYRGIIEESVTFDKPFSFGVMRSSFDEHLRNNIDVRYNEEFISFEEKANEVIVKTNKNVYSGAFLVGADGIGSKVALFANLNKKTKIVIAEEKELRKENNSDDALNVYLGYNFLGYGWKFTKKDFISVGAGAMKKFYKKGISNLIDPTYADIKIYPISLWDGDYNIAKGRVALVGEASSIVDPLNAAGIYHSIFSAKLLSEVILYNLKKGSKDFSQYLHLLDSTIFEEFRYGIALSNAFYPFLPMIKKVILNEHILEFIIRAQEKSGYLSYKEVFKRFEKSKRIEIKLIYAILKILKFM
ncbi:MAG: NAD(P)/FAD-dependent oxidoreductase [Caldisericaceae bacterium]